MKSLAWVHILVVIAFAGVLALAVPASAQLEIYANVAPPALPVYDQPEIPGPGYLWTPGYWAWDDFDEDYYWVPGTWVMAPQVGLYWTPGYWGWDSDSDRYGWNPGYWGPAVGFYGGIDYGYGYTGNGYEGGEWRGHDFYYNRPVTNFGNKTIGNFYDKQVQHNRTVNKLSYNGPGGVTTRPTPQQTQVRKRIAPTSIQVSHERAARSNLDLRAARNQGKPPIAATARPAEFTRGVVPAKAPTQQQAQPSMQRAQPQQQGQPGRQRGQPEKQAQRQQQAQQHQQQGQQTRQHEQPQQQFQQGRERGQPQQQGESNQNGKSGQPRKKRPGEWPN